MLLNLIYLVHSLVKSISLWQSFIITFIVFVDIVRKLGIFSNTIFCVIFSDRFFPITPKDEIRIDPFYMLYSLRDVPINLADSYIHFLEALIQSNKS